MKKPLSYKLALKEKQSDLVMVSRIQLGRCFGARRQGKHVAVLDRKA